MIPNKPPWFISSETMFIVIKNFVIIIIINFKHLANENTVCVKKIRCCHDTLTAVIGVRYLFL